MPSFHICNEIQLLQKSTMPPYIRKALGNATSCASDTVSPMRRARMEGSGTDCGGSFSPARSVPAHPHAAPLPSSTSSAPLAPLGLSLESLSLSRRSFFTPQIGHLSKERRRCCRGGSHASKGTDERTTALKGQPIRPPHRSVRCPSYLGRQWRRWGNLLGFALGIE